jgi:hypothetical protein
MKNLVTGGAGYIGSHACNVLAKRGFEPIGFDNLSRGNRWTMKWATCRFLINMCDIWGAGNDPHFNRPDYLIRKFSDKGLAMRAGLLVQHAV